MTRPQFKELMDEQYARELGVILKGVKKTNMQMRIISLVVVIGIFIGLFFILGNEYYSMVAIVGVATIVITYFLQSINNLNYLMSQVDNSREYFDKYNLHYLEEINEKLERKNKGSD